MKRIQLHQVILFFLVVIMGGIIVHAPLTVFIESRWPEVADVVKAWKELLLLTALVLLAVEVWRRAAWRRFLHDKVLQLVAFYALLHFLVAAIGPTSPLVSIAGLMIDLRYLAFFVAVCIFIRLYPQYQKLFLKVAVIGAVVVMGFAVAQQVLPRDFLTVAGYSKETIQPYLTVDENPDFVRYGSTLRGPNPLGAYAVMVLAGVVAYGMAVGRNITNKRIKYLHLFLALGSLVALWTSQSRSAWIAAVIVLLILLWVHYGRRVSRRTLALAASVLLVLALGVFMIRDTYFFHNVILHNNPSTGADTDSNAGHADSLIQGFQKMLASPLGNGVGSTGSASLYSDTPLMIENQYLYIAHEVGWLGLGLFIAIYYLLLKRLWQQRSNWRACSLLASGVGLAVIGLLLPVWVDDTVSVVWWGLTAVVLAEEGVVYGKSSNKKAKRAA